MTNSGIASGGEAQPNGDIVYPFVGPGYDPARGVIGASPDDEVIIVINYAIFDTSARQLVHAYMLRVYESLNRDAHPGYVGGSVIVGIDDAWTMSAWRDEESILTFYSSAVHVEAMDAVVPSVEETRPARTKIPARDVPFRWDYARKLLLDFAPDPRVARRGLNRDRRAR